MNYLKAVVAGIVGATMALVLVWLLGAVVGTVRLNWLMAQGLSLEGGLFPLWTAWLIAPMPFVAVAVGFWAGFRFMLALIEDVARREADDLQRQRGLPET